MTTEADLVADIEALGEKLGQARASIGKRFIGQERVVDLTLSALICGGHAVLVGLPGLGKTRLVDTLSTVMGLKRSPSAFCRASTVAGPTSPSTSMRLTLLMHREPEHPSGKG